MKKYMWMQAGKGRGAVHGKKQLWIKRPVEIYGCWRHVVHCVSGLWSVVCGLCGVSLWVVRRKWEWLESEVAALCAMPAYSS